MLKFFLVLVEFILKFFVVCLSKFLIIVRKMEILMNMEFFLYCKENVLILKFCVIGLRNNLNVLLMLRFLRNFFFFGDVIKIFVLILWINFVFSLFLL